MIIIENDREKIAMLADLRIEENAAFRDFIKNKNPRQIDQSVAAINAEVEKGIDCTKCGACCNSLMINVTQEELKNISDHLQIKETEFKDQYIEQSQNGWMIMNTIPCHFLSEKKCTVYEHRFGNCRSFPDLAKPNFTDRLFGTLIHYRICPIVFNVIEQLKITTHFFFEKQINAS